MKNRNLNFHSSPEISAEVVIITFFLRVNVSILFFPSIFVPALLRLAVCRKVNIRLVFVVTFDVFQVDDHVKAVGQDQQQDEGGDEAHQDGWCQEGSTVTRSRKFTRADVEGLDLVKEAKNCSDKYLLINLFD